MCVYGIGILGCECKTAPISDWKIYGCKCKFSQTDQWQTGENLCSQSIENWENFTCVYGNITIGCDWKILPISNRELSKQLAKNHIHTHEFESHTPLSENQVNFTCVYVNQTSGCEYKISQISDRDTYEIGKFCSRGLIHVHIRFSLISDRIILCDQGMWIVGCESEFWDLNCDWNTATQRKIDENL
jgi:hypothetical protein